MAVSRVGDRNHWIWKLLRIGMRVGVVVLSIVAMVGWLIYRSAQTVPEFYQTALAVSAEENATQGDVFETKFFDLQNAARSTSQWQAKFSEAEINGWLASDLPEKFPETLPSFVVDPRVTLNPSQLKLAVRYQTPRLSAIIVAEADVFTTEVPGQIAVRIASVRAGWLPIPVAKIADRITASLRQSNIRVAWTEENGSSVALLTLPPDFVKLGNRRVELESIQIMDQELVLIGKSDLDGNGN